MFKAYKPCYKEYSLKGLKSRFIKIHSSEWDIAAVLPVAKFRKVSTQKVWTESLKMIHSNRSKQNNQPTPPTPPAGQP